MNPTEIGIVMSALALALGCLANIERKLDMSPVAYVPTFAASLMLIIVALARLATP